jgi:hypothetical protein
MRPTKQSLEEIREIDARRAKVVRRGARSAGVRMTLRGIREAAGKTQAAVAAALETEQSEISRIEKREDVRLSTLRRYAAALGAECEVAFVFRKTGHRIVVADPE